jgi:hypothetical protein
MGHVLQHIVMPNLAFGAPEEMYVRLHNDKVHALMSERRLFFDAGGRASFDTFFNSFTVGAWKMHTVVQDLQLHLRGSGRFVVRLGIHRNGHAQRWLAERVVTFTPDVDVQMNVDGWSKLESGMLYFALEALEPGSLTGGYFATCTAPQREVKLGIVITHFNRKQWVLPAIERIRGELLSDPLYTGRIKLVVVDNSQNITAEEAQGITVIPNKNLGGSGGFTRGLLYLKDQQDFTHCLFMDDDASCETESIRRIFNFFVFSKTARLAVAGSLLREVEPYRLFEKGAKFIGVCKPLKSGLDMRHVSDLLFAELLDDVPDYGGWWFFCFEIKDVIEFAFPFFVRGDDSRFSIVNKFAITTMNGVSTWGDDFYLKDGPLPQYFDTRYHLLHAAIILNKSRFSQALFVLRNSLFHIFSYNYTSAQSVILASYDFSRGPASFLDDMDASNAREKIAKLGNAEKLSSLDRSKYSVVYRSSAEGWVRKMVRVVTLNGVLLPSFFFKKKTVFQHKSFRASFREVFAFQRVYYEYEPLSLGYIAEFKRAKAINLIFKAICSSINLLVKHDLICKMYLDASESMTSESFWRAVFQGRK